MAALTACSSTSFSAAQRKYIIFSATIYDKSRDNFIREARNLVRSGITDLYVIIQSPGGSFNAGVPIINFFSRELPNQNVTVTMHSIGPIYSMGLYVYLAAEKRFATSSTLFLLHKPKGGPIDSSTGLANPVDTMPVSTEDKRTIGEAELKVTTQLKNYLKNKTCLSPSEIDEYIDAETVIMAEAAKQKCIVQAVTPLSLAQVTDVPLISDIGVSMWRLPRGAQKPDLGLPPFTVHNTNQS